MTTVEHTVLSEPPATGSEQDWRSTPSTRRQTQAYCVVFGLALLAGWLAQRQLDISWHAFAAVACAVGTLLLLLAGLLATRRGPASRAILLTGVLVAWCGCSLGWTALHSLTQLPSPQGTQIWSVFHYYLGAKYFPELGYTGLYNQALAADAEGENIWEGVNRVRNLETYRTEHLGGDRPERSALWSDARWNEFKRDVGFLAPYQSLRTWHRIFRDRGYNPPPSFTALRRVLTAINLGPGTLIFLGSLDMIVLLAAFVVVGRVFGPLRGLVCATWVALYFGNGGDRFVGAPFLYDYLAAMLFAVCALKKERPVLAGVLLGYAAMMRVFPGILLVGVVWWAVSQWWRGSTTYRPAMRMATGFACACVLLFVAGLGSGRGVAGWYEFASNLTLHTEHHIVGSQRVGLAHLFTVDWSNPPMTDQGRSERLETWQAQKKPWLAVAVGVGLLWFWVTARTRLDLFDTTVSAIILIFCGVVLSRYYWSAACLLMLIGRPVRGAPLGTLEPVSIAATLFAWCTAIHAYSIFDGDALQRYLFANLLGFLLIASGLALFMIRAGRTETGSELGSTP